MYELQVHKSKLLGKDLNGDYFVYLIDDSVIDDKLLKDIVEKNKQKIMDILGVEK